MLEPKAIAIKSDELLAQDGHPSSPLRRQETFIMYYSNTSNKKNQQLYQSFNSDLSIFLVKIAASPLKKWAGLALDNKVILLGHQTTGQNIGFVNRVSLNYGKLTNIVLDTNNIGLDTSEDNPVARNIDKAVYSVYHALIRAAINLEFHKIRRDTVLRSSLIEWYHIMFLRSMNLPTLDDLNMGRFDFIIAYAITRFSLLENHIMAFSIASDYVKDKYASESDNIISDVKLSENIFKATKDFKDITKLFKILELTNDDSMKQIQQILKKIGTAGFITVVGPVDYAIAGIVIAIYSKEYSNLLLNSHLQQSLESSLDPYLKHIKFAP